VCEVGGGVTELVIKKLKKKIFCKKLEKMASFKAKKELFDVCGNWN
jgi:hypothetical protein